MDLSRLDPEARRLLWRCRRGMKELDIVLERYVRLHLAVSSAHERRILTALLELPDPVLADYLLGAAVVPDAELARLIAAIREAKPARVQDVELSPEL